MLARSCGELPAEVDVAGMDSSRSRLPPTATAECRQGEGGQARQWNQGVDDGTHVFLIVVGLCKLERVAT